MKREYVKPAMAIDDIEPVNMIATSGGDLDFGVGDKDPDINVETGGDSDGGMEADVKDRTTWGNLWW